MPSRSCFLPFRGYLDWRLGEGLLWDGPLDPADSATSRLLQQHADGRQVGALSHWAALPPLVSFAVSMDEHFTECQRILGEETPLELRFAAWWAAEHPRQLQEFCQGAIGVLKELVNRWNGVTVHLRRFQMPARVTASRNIGLPGLLMVLLSWADFTYPHGLIKGLPAVGFAPKYGVFPEQDARFLSLDDVLEDADANNASILGGLRPGKDDAFLLEQSCKDAEHGFCSQPMNKTELLSVLKGRRFLLIPRCVITQANGKQRIIDDAARGGQSDLSSDRNISAMLTAAPCATHLGSVCRGIGCTVERTDAV